MSSDPTDILPLPTLANSLKEEVLKKTANQFFPTKKLTPAESMGCPNKEALPLETSSSSHVFPSSCGEQEGSTADISQCHIEKKDDGSLC